MAKAKPTKKKQIRAKPRTARRTNIQSEYVTVMVFVFFLLSLLFLAMVFVKYY